MTTTEPWFTPLAATEVEHLVASLDLLRTTFRWKADDLDSAGLAHDINFDQVLPSFNHRAEGHTARSPSETLRNVLVSPIIERLRQ